MPINLLRQYKIEEEYNNEKCSLEEGIVCLVDENLEIKFNHKSLTFVDLGLPSGLLWAEQNIGACKPEERGLYFAWGETQGYNSEDINNGVKQFTWADYELCNGSNTTITKYNSVDKLITLELVDDAAAYNTDNLCRMPTKLEVEELISNTTSNIVVLNGVNGKIFTSNINGNSIFFPIAGRCDNGSIKLSGTYGSYWVSSLNESNSINGWNLYFNSNTTQVYSFNRSYGLNIRAVKN